MPFTIMKSNAATAAEAIARGHEQHEHEDGDSQMAANAAEPMRDDDAAEKTARHPQTGQYVSEQTAFGATSPLTVALAQHRAPAPLATLQTAGAPALASSYAPGEVRVQSLDYRGAVPPLAVAAAPIQTAPNGPRP